MRRGSPPDGKGDPSGKPRILFRLRSDANRASSRVRGHWIAGELQALGASCRIEVARTFADHLRCAALVARHDVVVFQKRNARSDRLLAGWARLLGRRTYYDLDDAPRVRGRRRAVAMMKAVDGVLAGSGLLVELARSQNPNVHLVPSGVRIADYDPAPARAAPDRVCLGWIGSGLDYAEDLVTILREPIAALAARHPLRLKIVGASGQRRIHEAFAAIPGLEAEIVDAIEWSRPGAASDAIADFDIGLYPLLDLEFNRYKCGFKALEYMAMAIPVVASNLVANAEIVTDGVDGFLATGDQEWTDRLGRLVADADLRASFGRAGRAKVERDFSTRQIAERLLGIFATEASDSRTAPADARPGRGR